jgi:cytochrome P450
LPYLRAVYDESLRLFPPIPTVARTAEQEDAIRGHRIPPGGFVVLVPWLTHRDARWWPEPEKFDPERFLNSATKANRPKYSYFPFGGGARFCMGAGLALLQGPLILATLAQKYRLRVAADFEIRPRVTITILPDGGLPVTLERR